MPRTTPRRRQIVLWLAALQLVAHVPCTLSHTVPLDAIPSSSRAAVTVQMDWLHHATYSRYHPDNLKKVIAPLPDPVKAPPPVVQLSEIDKKVYGGWGHRLCCERPYGPVETTLRIKDSVTAKVGSTWRSTVHAERGTSISQSAIYGGSFIEPSFEQLVEMRNKKG